MTLYVIERYYASCILKNYEALCIIHGYEALHIIEMYEASIILIEVFSDTEYNTSYGYILPTLKLNKILYEIIWYSYLDVFFPFIDLEIIVKKNISALYFKVHPIGLVSLSDVEFWTVTCSTALHC